MALRMVTIITTIHVDETDDARAAGKILYSGSGGYGPEDCDPPVTARDQAFEAASNGITEAVEHHLSALYGDVFVNVSPPTTESQFPALTDADGEVW